MSEEEEFRELQKRYEGLDYEKGWWQKAWIVVQEHGREALRWIKQELNYIWMHGGREIVTLAVLVGIVSLLIPAAAVASLEVAAVLVPVILYRAFQAA